MNWLGPWERTPDHVNDTGVKWWKDDAMTRVARARDGVGLPLPGAAAWYTELPGGTRCRVLTVGGQVVIEAQALDEFYFKVNRLRLTDGVAEEAVRITRGNLAFLLDRAIRSWNHRVPGGFDLRDRAQAVLDAVREGRTVEIAEDDTPGPTG